jgi:hypothetical protein
MVAQATVSKLKRMQAGMHVQETTHKNVVV